MRRKDGTGTFFINCCARKKSGTDRLARAITAMGCLTNQMHVSPKTLFQDESIFGQPRFGLVPSLLPGVKTTVSKNNVFKETVVFICKSNACFPKTLFQDESIFGHPRLGFTPSLLLGLNYSSLPQHFLYFLPLPQGHGSFLPTFLPLRTVLLAVSVPSPEVWVGCATCSRFRAASTGLG